MTIVLAWVVLGGVLTVVQMMGGVFVMAGGVCSEQKIRGIYLDMDDGLKVIYGKFGNFLTDTKMIMKAQMRNMVKDWRAYDA